MPTIPEGPGGRGGDAARLKTVAFYTKEECELCERAWALLQLLGAGRGFVVDRVDIGKAGGAILERYRDRVPVVRSPSGKELDLWIDPVELEMLLREVRG